MQLVPNKVEAFLLFDEIVSLNDSLKSQTASLIGIQTNQTAIATTIFEWVRDQIPHTKDIGAEIVTCTAIETYQHKTGICFAKSHLLAAMMRYANIPCGFCYQIFDDLPNASSDSAILHGLNAVFLKETGQWHRIDARGNRDGIHSEFSLDREILAFPECTFLDENIYSVPLSIVVSGLRDANSIASLWFKLSSVPRVR